MRQQFLWSKIQKQGLLAIFYQTGGRTSRGKLAQPEEHHGVPARNY